MTELEDSYQFYADMNKQFSLKENLPNSEFQSLTDFLDQAKEIVRIQWVDYLVEELTNLPSSPTRDKLFRICKDKNGLKDLLSKEKFREFEILRFEGEKELWHDIVSAISDREISTITLTKDWLAKLPDSEINKFSLSRAELNLFLDLSLSLQEAVDAAYFYQMQIADTPEGKQTSSNVILSGYEYLYRDQIPYIEVFEDEFTALVSILYEFSDEIAGQVKNGTLPPSYQKLSEYLNHLGFGFGSYEIDAVTITEIWKKIDYEYLELVNSGCPILINPWGFIIEGNHIGIELMTTLSLGYSSPLYPISSEYLNLADEIVKPIDKEFQTIPFVHQYVFVRNGINLPWSGTAVAGNRYIAFYDNENDDFSKNLYLTYYDDFIDGDTTKDRFTYVRAVNTVAHETGHLFRMLDEVLYKKMGFGLSLNKLEETKADCIANLLFLKKLSTNGSDITPGEFIEQYIIDYIDEMRASKGHETEDAGITWYDFSAKVILHTLFQNKAITWSENKIKIIDGLKGVEALASLGQEIFELYGEMDFKESAIKLYVSMLEIEISADQEVQRFLEKVSST